jgi:threonine aldolase
MDYIDLRSDTVTKPSTAMRQAMMEAEVGDDVFAEDPTVNRLQNRIAQMFGKEAALFVPSGTMGNEICIKVHTQPGDEIIVEQESHIFVYETAGPSFLSGVQMNPIPGMNGMITVQQIKEVLRPKTYYLPKSALICIENTHGRSAGSVIPIDSIREIHTMAKDANIKMHLDGARLWNASIASGIPVHEYAKYFDTVSVCFSKGLGAPAGSIIVGDTLNIERARVYRKIFGGGMRQIGILAAAALYALDHNVERLKEDHDGAKYFANEIKQLKKLKLTVDKIETNMVFIDIVHTGKSQSEIIQLLHHHGVLVTPEKATSVRVVTHLDVSSKQIESAVGLFRSLFS